MSKKRILCCLLGLLLTTVQFGQCQITDTLYYQNDWNLSSPDHFTYYIVSEVDTADHELIGKFKGYNVNDILIIEGSYDHQSDKEGLFTRYYNNGNIHSIGAFSKGKMVGIWKYYNEDGVLYQEIEFQSNDFVILNYFDSKGKQKISNGTGKRKYQGFTLSNSRRPNILEVEFKNRKRDGKWKVEDLFGITILTENYEQGVLKSAKDAASKESYFETRISSAFLYPKFYSKIENFVHIDDLSREHYPYLEDLKYPEPSAVKVLNDDGTVSLAVGFPPRPLGGLSSFNNFIRRNLRYSKEALRSKVGGVAHVQFTVEKDGSLSNIEVLKDPGYGLKEEAIRIIENSPKWKSGIVDGKTIRSKMILPIKFNKPQVIGHYQ